MPRSFLLVAGLAAVSCASDSLRVEHAAQEPPPSEQRVISTRQAVLDLTAALDEFRLRLIYHGPTPELRPSIQLDVKAPPVAPPRFCQAIRISREQAAVLIGYLAADGFLDRDSMGREKRNTQPFEPYYDLYVSGPEDNAYFEFLPWSDPALPRRLNGLRDVLLGEAAQAMDALRRSLENPVPERR